MSGVESAPAPWTLNGRMWIFFLSSIGAKSSFPAGFAAPYETDALAEGGEFIAGPGTLQLVSYTESPVGPYDELIYSPGRWKYSDGRTGFRVTRIFVSTKESTENGRRNWNIPKQVAKFDYLTNQDGTSSFSVTLPEASEPFFKASVAPISLLSSLPFRYRSGMMGKYLQLIQPPLPVGNNPEEVATKQWATIVPDINGTACLMRLTPGFEGGAVGDGINFPAVQPWSIGMSVTDVTLKFGEAEFSDAM